MKITFHPKISLSITGLCILSFLLLTIFKLPISGLFILNGEFQKDNITWYLSTIFYIFGHANFLHLLGNLSLFLILAPIIEKAFGMKKFILMVLTTAITTAIIHVIFWDNGLMGLSGIVFMLIILSTLTHAKANEIPFTFILVLIFYLSQEIYASFSNDNISHMAHLAGGGAGVFWGYFKR